MTRSLQNKPARWKRWIACASVLGLFFCSSPLPVDPGLSTGNYSPAVILQKDFRFHHFIKSGLPLNFPRGGWVVDWTSSFFTVDRKQNLRLWPVIASGITRSPPRA
jgi:hypothetical protein